MNKAILHKNVQEYIQQNLHSDITKLILKGSPFSNVSSQELANQIITKQKAKNKLPTWYATEGVYYPNKLNIEQTSSEITALYKSSIVSGNSLIDITGGFGVDTYFFAKKFKEVIHCELDNALSEIASYNTRLLSTTNISMFAVDGMDFIQNTQNKFDCIYVDPSRRDDIKGKVFLLKDCTPNIPENLETLFEKSDTILIKNSPILDIKSTIEELRYVKEIHIVAVHNEVKELLFLLEKGFEKNIQVKTINYTKSNIQKFNFDFNAEAIATYNYPQQYLYEPNAAILKSGAFQQVSSQLNVQKLHQHSHLYTSRELLEDFPGRIFNVEGIFPFDKRLRKTLPFKKANITTRNFPKTVAQIRKELKLKDGGASYLFFSTNIDNKLIVIDCVKNLLKH